MILVNLCLLFILAQKLLKKKKKLLEMLNGIDNVPSSLRRQLVEIAPNNNLGEIIKVLMITSGSEGITLKNTRFVHLIEPYWHL